MRSLMRGFLPVLVAWLPLVLFPGAADASIEKPKIEQLVDSADLIVVGTVESVRPTSPALWRQVGNAALLIASGAVVAVLFWRRKVAVASCFGLACLLAVFLLEVPFGVYRKVARASVSTAIKGAPSPGGIAIYYDEGLVCDETCFDVGQEYLLILKKHSSDFTVSWYDWSVWTVKGGQAQTERRARCNAAPIPVADLAARIEDILDGQRQDK